MTEMIITRHFGVDGMRKLFVARQHGAYLTLEKVRRASPADIVREVEESELRGRGGAGFPVARKWAMIPKKPEGPVYLVVNADESEPGTFKDRAIMENDPHLVIEGMIIAARAIGARVAYVYFRGEYTGPLGVFSRALEEARSEGIIGEDGPLKDVMVYRGAGSYVCGEETAMLRSIEGHRGLPSAKPPYPVERGLFGAPTVVNNVETLASLPYIVREGPKSFKKLGTERSRGTKLVSVSGAVMSPGVYEVEMGTPLSAFLKDEAGGMAHGRPLKAVMPGGISTAVLTASEALACTIDYESFAEAGSALGSGGMIVMDESTSMVGALAAIARFFADESCGKCTPCREGTVWLKKVLERMESGSSRPSDPGLIAELACGMAETSLCPLAGSLATPALSFVAKFRGEFERAASS